jgi:hypothetical protein
MPGWGHRKLAVAQTSDSPTILPEKDGHVSSESRPTNGKNVSRSGGIRRRKRHPPPLLHLHQRLRCRGGRAPLRPRAGRRDRGAGRGAALPRGEPRGAPAGGRAAGGAAGAEGGAPAAGGVVPGAGAAAQGVLAPPAAGRRVRVHGGAGGAVPAGAPPPQRGALR